MMRLVCYDLIMIFLVVVNIIRMIWFDMSGICYYFAIFNCNLLED